MAEHVKRHMANGPPDLGAGSSLYVENKGLVPGNSEYPVYEWYTGYIGFGTALQVQARMSRQTARNLPRESAGICSLLALALLRHRFQKYVGHPLPVIAAIFAQMPYLANGASVVLLPSHAMQADIFVKLALSRQGHAVGICRPGQFQNLSIIVQIEQIPFLIVRFAVEDAQAVAAYGSMPALRYCASCQDGFDLGDSGQLPFCRVPN